LENREEYERKLFMELHAQWDPARGLVMQSRKTEPLSDGFKASLAELGAKAGMTVTFPVEPKWGGAEGEVQHFVHAVRPRKTPAP
jgi:hypothetical protein